VSEDRIRTTVGRYLEAFSANDRDGWVALFAADATLEDPVGTDVRTGHEAISAFWDESHAAGGTITLKMVQGPNVVAGQCAFAMEAHVEIGEGTDLVKMVIPTIDVMTFDDDSRITSQRAFWNGADVRTV
jgi:steroid delta-isomerase